MQYQDHIRTSDLAARLFAGVNAGFSTLAARYRHYRVYSRTLAELRTLSDRDLNDLGLGVADLRAVARKAADQKVQI